MKIWPKTAHLGLDVHGELHDIYLKDFDKPCFDERHVFFCRVYTPNRDNQEFAATKSMKLLQHVLVPIPIPSMGLLYFLMIYGFHVWWFYRTWMSPSLNQLTAPENRFVVEKDIRIGTTIFRGYPRLSWKTSIALNFHQLYSQNHQSSCLRKWDEFLCFPGC